KGEPDESESDDPDVMDNFSIHFLRMIRLLLEKSHWNQFWLCFSLGITGPSHQTPEAEGFSQFRSTVHVPPFPFIPALCQSV
ncbi:hypothetical protein AMECASPLE_036872, partial [Ameca splendens]